jgi:hypothetical protein
MQNTEECIAQELRISIIKPAGGKWTFEDLGSFPVSASILGNLEPRSAMFVSLAKRRIWEHADRLRYESFLILSHFITRH